MYDDRAISQFLDRTKEGQGEKEIVIERLIQLVQGRHLHDY